MGYDVGTAYIDIVPSFRNIRDELHRTARRITDDLNETIGDAIPDAVKQGAHQAERESRRTGGRIGDRLGGHFADSLDKAIDKAMKSVGELEIKADSSQARRTLRQLRNEMGELREQRIDVDIDPDQAYAALRGMSRRLREVGEQTDDIRFRLDSREAATDLDAWAARAAAGGKESLRQAEQRAREETRIVEKAERDRARIRERIRAQQEADERRLAERAERDRARMLERESDRHIDQERERLSQQAHRSAARLRSQFVDQEQRFRRQAAQERNQLQEKFDASIERMRSPDGDEDGLSRDERASRERTRLHKALFDERARLRRTAAEQERAATQNVESERARIVEKGNDRVTRLRARHAERERQAAEQAQRDRARLLERFQAGELVEPEHVERERARLVQQGEMDAARLRAEHAEQERQVREQLERDRVRLARQGEDEVARVRQRHLADQERVQEQFHAGMRRMRVQQAADERRDRERAERDNQVAIRLAARQAEKEFGKTWAGRIQNNLKEAFQRLPDIAGAPADDSDQKIKDLRGRLAALADKRVGVDIDTTQAKVEIAEVRTELMRLAQSSPNVQVQADTAGASAKLLAIQQLMTLLDSRRIDVRVNVDSDRLSDLDDVSRLTLSRLEKIVAACLSLGTVISPVAATVVSSIGWIGTTAAAAASGVGALALGMSGVGQAVKALSAYEKDLEKSNRSVTSSQSSLVRSTDSVASAERALANTRASNAESAARAARQVQDAERALTRAKLEAQQVELGLTRAREQARRVLQDMAFDAEEMALSQRQATLDLVDAKRVLDRLLDNPRATDHEKERASVAYEQVDLRMRQLTVQQERLAKAQKEANKAGIEGSEQVVAVREQIRAKTEAVIAAERRLADARVSQASQQRQAAYSLASAQQSLATAYRGAGFAAQRAGAAGSDAMDDLKDAMKNLSPATQDFARFMLGLRGEFYSLRAAAASNMLPRFQEAIEGLLPRLPGFRTYLAATAAAVGDLAIESVRLLDTDPTWVRFGQHMKTQTVPMLHRLYEILRDTTTGLLGLILGFSGFDGNIGSGFAHLMARFASWASLLDQDRGFQEFLAYVREAGPGVVELVSELLSAIMHIVEAAGPIGSTVAAAITSFAAALNAIPLPILTALIGAISLYSSAMLLSAGATRLATYRAQVYGRTMNTLRAAKNSYSRELVTARTRLDSFVRSTYDARQAAGQSWNTWNRVGTVFRYAGQQMVYTSAALTSVTNGLKSTWGAISHPITSIQNGFASITAAAQRANTSVGGFKGVLAGVQAATRTARAGLSSLVGFLGGPWGVAITGAIIATSLLMSKQQEHKQRVDDLTSALHLLGKAYRETKSVTSEAARDAVNHSKELTSLVINAEKYGVAVETIARAAAGEKAAQDAILDALQRRQAEVLRAGRRGGTTGHSWTAGDALSEARDIGVVYKALEKQFAEVQRNVEASRRLDEAQQRVTASARPFTAAQQQIADAHQRNAQRIDYLTRLMRIHTDAEVTAADKANLLREAIDRQTAPLRAAIENTAAWSRGLNNLRESVKQNGAVIGDNSDAARNNSDAIRDAAEAAREMFLADIEAGKGIAEATKAHDKRIAKLVDEAKELGLVDKKTGQLNDSVKKLIDAYGKIDKSILTEFDTVNFEKVYEELQMLQFMQFALAEGKSPAEAAKAWKDKKLSEAYSKISTGRIGGLADGGPVIGPGTATSDSILARLSDGEFVQPARSVNYYGPEFMEALRRRRVPKDVLPGFAGGGTVRVPFRLNLLRSFIPTADEVRANVFKSSPSSGGIGVTTMMRILRAVFPGLPLYSGFRPNDYTTESGGLSYHGMIAKNGEQGRAVDLPPRKDVFNYIHDNHFAGTRELIWAGDPDRNIWNGKHHRYSASLLAQHGVAGQPNAHVHWAYDQGGYLPPGVSTVVNNTGRPEPVFTDGQWKQISALARSGRADRPVQHIYNFRDHDLDMGRLRALEDRQNALARVGRPG